MFKKLFATLMGRPVGYVSPADKFLAQVRQRYPQPSASQVSEQANAAKIAALRDGTAQPTATSPVWRDF